MAFQAPVGMPMIVSTGFVIRFQVATKGLFSALPAASANAVGLAHLVERGERLDFADARAQHPITTKFEITVIRRDDVPVQKSGGDDLRIDAVMRAGQQVGW